MEYLRGQPLHRVLTRLDEVGGIPVDAYLAVVAEALTGLHYAHELTDYDGTPLAIVHRDVSPHNVFVTYDGRVKLLDFGIAKGLDSGLETRSGIVKGKAGYMSPEQASGNAIDRRSDVYSAGVMIWEAITGARLWRGLNDVAIIGRLMLGDIPHPRTIRENVPDALVSVCMRALAREPEHRYPTAEALRMDLVSAMAACDMKTSLEEVGRLVAEAFAEERARLRRAVAARLPRTSSENGPSDFDVQSSPTLRGVTPMEFTTGIAGASASRRSARTAPEDRSPDSAPTIPPPRETRRRRRDRVATVSVVAVVVVLMGIAVSWPRIIKEDLHSGATTNSNVNSSIVLGPTAVGSRRDKKPMVEISGDIERDSVLDHGKDYLLKFNVFVRRGVTLTIEKGTTLMGDSDTKAALVVQPGARIVAEGSPDEPIVFTSERPLSERKPGDWGGVIVLGNAPTNLSDEHGRPRQGKVEGITSGGEYGGSDEDDDSGVLRYVRIEYAGTELAPGNEINGLTLAGVGRKTAIDHVQVREVTDDCFEFFGGTVDAKHLICQHGGDDGFDWDLGYRGRLQFLIFRQAPRSENGSNGFEGDNDPNGSRNEPRSGPVVFNATLCGAGNDSPGEQYGILARRGTEGRIANSIFAGFDAAIDVRDKGTSIDVVQSTFYRDSTHAVAYPETPAGRGPFADDDDGFDEGASFLEPSRKNDVAAPDLPGCANPDTPDFLPTHPRAGSGATPPADGFFDRSATFLGAVRDENDHWLKESWIVWSAR